MAEPARVATAERPWLLLLDFDGVIVESVGIKDAAFRALLPEYPHATDAIMAYHLAHNAVDRYAKFRYIFEHILREPYTDAWAAELKRRFDAATHAQIVRCPFVPGAEELLRAYSGTAPMYLLSATPKNELDAIVRARGLERFFTGVIGAPERKTDAIQRILALHGLPASRAIFVGDSPEDAKAARETGVRFFGRLGHPGLDAIGVEGAPDLLQLRVMIDSVVHSGDANVPAR